MRTTGEIYEAFAAMRACEREEERRLCEERHRAKRAQIDADYEAVQQLARRYDPKSFFAIHGVDPRLKRGDLEDGYCRKQPDHGLGLPTSAPSLGVLGEPEDVEELCFE